VVGQPGPPLAGSRVLPGITLHGNPVRFADLAHERCLTWLLKNGHVTRVCSDVGFSPTNPTNGDEHGLLLSLNQLLKVARSIP